MDTYLYRYKYNEFYLFIILLLHPQSTYTHFKYTHFPGHSLLCPLLFFLVVEILL